MRMTMSTEMSNHAWETSALQRATSPEVGAGPGAGFWATAELLDVETTIVN